ncbi:hypothetical protein L1887_59320 [Cichorium endivia]|nr:hypothetical protein L1887_59320 [Cichorium endivia]
MMSPGTTSLAEMVSPSPFRMTRAVGEARLRRAFMVFSAESSWKNPTMMLMATDTSEHATFDPRADAEGYAHGKDQDQSHGIGDLVKSDLPDADLIAAFELVGTILLASRFDVALVETVLGILYAESAQDAGIVELPR